VKQKTAHFFPFIFCFIRELNPHSPLISILPPTYPPIPPPIHDCAYGAFYYLGSECDHLPEAGNTYIGIHPSAYPSANVAKLIAEGD
jgi:hypothetical protein